MPSNRSASTARNQILTALKDDHKRVKKAYRDFQKIDTEANPKACGALVGQVLDELTVHAALEEELLYPALRGAMAEESLIDEAEVEHESIHSFIDQLRGMSPDDDKYAARFTVLCEYVMHHVKEEEGEIFPQLEHTRLDWEGLAAEMSERREELTPAGEGSGKAPTDSGHRAEPGPQDGTHQQRGAHGTSHKPARGPEASDKLAPESPESSKSP